MAVDGTVLDVPDSIANASLWISSQPFRYTSRISLIAVGDAQ